MADSVKVNVKQKFLPIDSSQLLTKVKDLKAKGYRFAQACATIYSFDKDHMLTNLRLTVSQGEQVESITGDFWPAFIYENEMHDLFGIKFAHMALDYEGKFFKVAEPTPWNPNK